MLKVGSRNVKIKTIKSRIAKEKDQRVASFNALITEENKVAQRKKANRVIFLVEGRTQSRTQPFIAESNFAFVDKGAIGVISL
jgi:hypothetical protein